MKRKKMIYILVFLFASMVWLSNVVNAESVVVELPDDQGNNAFTVQDSDTSPLMHVKSDGIVGVGTSSPTSFVDIQRSSSSGLMLGPGGYPALRVMNTLPTLGDAVTDFNFAALLLQSGNGAVQGGLFTRYDDSDFNGLYLWDNSNHPIGFFTNAIERMRIESGTGNVIINATTTARVGIGTTSPDDKLDIDLGAFGSLNAGTPLGNGPGWIFNASNGHRRDLVGWDGGLDPTRRG